MTGERSFWFGRSFESGSRRLESAETERAGRAAAPPTRSVSADVEEARLAAKAEALTAAAVVARGYENRNANAGAVRIALAYRADEAWARLEAHHHAPLDSGEHHGAANPPSLLPRSPESSGSAPHDHDGPPGNALSTLTGGTEPLDSTGPAGVGAPSSVGSAAPTGARVSGPDLHSVRAELIPIRPRRGLTLLRRDNARYHRQHLTRLTAQAEQLADSTRALLDDLHADDIPAPCRAVAVALLRLRQAQEALDHATGKVNVNEGDPSGN